MLLYSETLKKEIELSTFPKENQFGQMLQIVTHNSLEDLFNNELKELVSFDNNLCTDYSFDEVLSNEKGLITKKTVGFLFKCVMQDKNGRKIIEFGEANTKNLETEIAQNYPALTASQRAFDRAAIAYLNIPGKVYSDLEIPINEPISMTDVDTPSAFSNGIVSSVVEDAPNEDFIIDDIHLGEPVIEDSYEETFLDKEVVVDEEIAVDEEILEDDILEEDVEVSLPFEEETASDDCSDYVITMPESNFYADKNMTIAEIAKTPKGLNWIKWIAENFSPHNKLAEADVNAVKRYWSAHKEN